MINTQKKIKSTPKSHHPETNFRYNRGNASLVVAMHVHVHGYLDEIKDQTLMLVGCLLFFIEIEHLDRKGHTSPGCDLRNHKVDTPMLPASSSRNGTLLAPHKVVAWGPPNYYFPRKVATILTSSNID